MSKKKIGKKRKNKGVKVTERQAEQMLNNYLNDLYDYLVKKNFNTEDYNQGINIGNEEYVLVSMVIDKYIELFDELKIYNKFGLELKEAIKKYQKREKEGKNGPKFYELENLSPINDIPKRPFISAFKMPFGIKPYKIDVDKYLIFKYPKDDLGIPPVGYYDCMEGILRINPKEYIPLKSILEAYIILLEITFEQERKIHYLLKELYSYWDVDEWNARIIPDTIQEAPYDEEIKGTEDRDNQIEKPVSPKIKDTFIAGKKIKLDWIKKKQSI